MVQTLTRSCERQLNQALEERSGQYMAKSEQNACNPFTF
jgi:hypothetical protein